MKATLPILLALTIVSLVSKADNTKNEDHYDPKQFMREKLVVILGSFKDFHEAHKQASAISRASKMPFSMQGMIYDKKRGLIISNDDPDETYRGKYVCRRYNMISLDGKGEGVEYISIERSEAYPGFAHGYYIVVGGIYNDAKDAKIALSRFKTVVSDAYGKKTKIYMGCIH